MRTGPRVYAGLLLFLTACEGVIQTHSVPPVEGVIPPGNYGAGASIC